MLAICTSLQTDSVQLYTSVTGGIEPVSYSWSPTTALLDLNTENPYVSPTMDMGYVATLTDSAGCQFSEQDVFQVFVDVSDLSTAENNNFNAFFDYTLNELKIKNAKNELYRYSKPKFYLPIPPPNPHNPTGAFQSFSSIQDTLQCVDKVHHNIPFPH